MKFSSIKKIKDTFLKEIRVHTLSFLQLLFIIINTQRHFQGYTNCMQEFWRSQFPESNCEKIVSLWMITKALKLQFFFILRCQLTISVVALHSFKKFYFLPFK